MCLLNNITVFRLICFNKKLPKHVIKCSNYIRSEKLIDPNLIVKIAILEEIGTKPLQISSMKTAYDL